MQTVSPAPTGKEPSLPPPTPHPVVVVPAATANKSLAQVTFGNEEDIERVRRRHKSTPRRTPKPANPVLVKLIPAVEMVGPASPAADLFMLSIWDMAG
jgi:hypothetical protein